MASETKHSSLRHRTVIQVSLMLVMVSASFAQHPEKGLPSGDSHSASAPDLLPSQSAAEASSQPQESGSEDKQTGRILWVIPNYRAVSADAHLPPLSFRGKFKLATEDSFDYSSFLVAGFTAGISQARNGTPEFHQGAAGYGRY